MLKTNYSQIIIQKNVLLLQGPVGPFFKNFYDFLKSNKTTVYKINFHYGEQFFFNNSNSFLYKDTIKNWASYFATFVTDHNIQQIFLIGAHKVYHAQAIDYCKQNNIAVYIFEEGYIRPNYITIEQDGVNGDSKLLLNTCDDYANWKIENTFELQPTLTLNVVARYYNLIRFYYAYSIGVFASQWLIPNYKHHIPVRGWKVFFKWNLFLIRSIFNTIFPFKKENTSQWFYDNQQKYYITILQINTDSAITQYSQYDNMESFIKEVMTSFAQNAPKNTKLVIKHHPYDRGIHCYKKIIVQLANQLNISNRINYLIDAHLELALENSIGCITVNSTTGLLSLAHNIPTIALSTKAIYRVNGLTNNHELDKFWTNPIKPDMVLFNKYKSYLIYQTQLRGCFYGGTICDFKHKFIFEKP